MRLWHWITSLARGRGTAPPPVDYNPEIDASATGQAIRHIRDERQASERRVEHRQRRTARTGNPFVDEIFPRSGPNDQPGDHP